jgi:glycine cleavage system T protein (aminomethyltransferase)
LSPAAPSQASRVAVPVYSRDRQVGKVTTTAFSPLLKKLIALASVSTEFAKLGTELQMELTIEAQRMKTTATVVSLPFFNPKRKTAVPV